MSLKRSSLAAWSFGLVLLADLATKWLVQARFQLGESLAICPGLALTYVMNPGAAFSLFATWNGALRLPMFIGITLVALGGIVYYYRSLQESDRMSVLALGLVAGGAVGNLIDRARYGQVVDFIEVGVRSVYTWPIFNVADSAVCVGVGLLVWRSFKPVK